ncbi:hypothetical protein FCV73_21755 [Vibrio sp. F13]|uniref:hypothetical protein n=1 Tax=unclassified Vibrio TaxID=2614977 RepID=UPI0010BCF0BC|nr:hypothetical protein [Vibrio sp. F13]TKF86666.1 hypothetical protein FCV73_21755 [Vibrio sp. F13]
MLYLFIFVIGSLGSLSGNFLKHGEGNIRRAGGPSYMVLPQLFAPALLVSFLTSWTPYIAIALVGFSIGWLEALLSFGVTFIAAFLCGFLPFSIRHIVVFLSPTAIGWAFYQIWIY